MHGLGTMLQDWPRESERVSCIRTWPNFVAFNFLFRPVRPTLNFHACKIVLFVVKVPLTGRSTAPRQTGRDCNHFVWVPSQRHRRYQTDTKQMWRGRRWTGCMWCTFMCRRLFLWGCMGLALIPEVSNLFAAWSLTIALVHWKPEVLVSKGSVWWLHSRCCFTRNCFPSCPFTVQLGHNLRGTWTLCRAIIPSIVGRLSFLVLLGRFLLTLTLARLVVEHYYGQTGVSGEP